MRIGELATRTRVSPRLLRYYEQQGLLKATRQPNGYREYSDEAVDAVRRIRLLLDAGLNSETIRTLLPCVHGESPRVELCEEIDSVMAREVAAIDDEVARLTHQREALLALLRHDTGASQP